MYDFFFFFFFFLESIVKLIWFRVHEVEVDNLIMSSLNFGPKNYFQLVNEFCFTCTSINWIYLG